MKCHNNKLPSWRRGFAHTKQLPWLMSQADKIGRTHWVNQLGAAGAGLSTVIWIREQEAAAFWLTPALKAALSCSQLVVKQPRPSVSVLGASSHRWLTHRVLDPALVFVDVYLFCKYWCLYLFSSLPTWNPASDALDAHKQNKNSLQDLQDSKKKQLQPPVFSLPLKVVRRLLLALCTQHQHLDGCQNWHVIGALLWLQHCEMFQCVLLSFFATNCRLGLRLDCSWIWFKSHCFQIRTDSQHCFIARVKME